MKVAALFIDPAGIYPTLPDVETWGPEQDARLYDGPHPVVAHPPCNLWVNMAAVNWKRYGKQLPAWYPDGGDGGCFARALDCVMQYGGVLEHPANTHAWKKYGLVPPHGRYVLGPISDRRENSQWLQVFSKRYSFYWVCEVYQSSYGHKARKKTWLLYCGKQSPFELRWDRNPGTHQIGWFDRNKPTLGKREASATPREFAEELVKLARWSRGRDSQVI